MVPEGWATDELGKLLLDIKGGGTPSKKNPAFWDGDIPWASVKDITKDRHTKTEDYITPEGLKDSASNLIPAGTIIIATRMAVGKAVRFSCDVAINQDLKAIFPDPKLSPDFLFFWFNAHEKAISDLASGSTVLGIRLESLRAMKILLPPIHEQKKIAVILGGVDAAIDSTQAVIEQTKKVKQGLLQTLLTRGIGHTKFKPSPLGEIPEGWEVKSIGETIRIDRGFAFKSEQYTDSGVFVMRVSNISDDGHINRLENTRFVSSGTAKEYANFYLASEDVLLVMVGATTGKLGFVREKDLPALLNQNMWCLRVNSDVLDKSFFEFLISKEIQRFLAMQQGSAREFLTQRQFSTFEIPIPPMQEQIKIARLLRSQDGFLSAETTKLASLQQLKKGLMDDLLTGKVRVA